MTQSSAAAIGAIRTGDAGHLAGSPLRWPVFFVCLWLNGLGIVAIVVMSLWNDQPPDVYFEEGAAITYFSAAQLGMLAGLALQLFIVRSGEVESLRSRTAMHTLVWPIVAVGMLVLACDEAFELHEKLDQMLHSLLALGESPWTDRIDDVIVLLYGLIGLGTLWVFRSELRKFRHVWPYLTIAFALFFVMVVIDLLTNSYSIAPEDVGDPAAIALLAGWGRVIEDSCKLFSEAAFIGAFVAMLGAARQMRRTQQK